MEAGRKTILTFANDILSLLKYNLKMKKISFFTLALLSLLAFMPAKAQIAPTAIDVAPLLVGESVPDGQLTTVTGEKVSVHSMLSTAPCIIVFYRGKWCHNCIDNFKAEYAPHLQEIADLGYHLIAISPDSPTNLDTLAIKSGIDRRFFFQDENCAFTQAMGLAWKQNDRMSKYLLESSGGTNTNNSLPVTSVFVVNKDFEILFESVAPNAIPAAKRMKWSLLGPVLKALE